MIHVHVPVSGQPKAANVTESVYRMNYQNQALSILSDYQ